MLFNPHLVLQRCLSALLLLLLAGSVLAADRKAVNLSVNGVDEVLKKNVLAHLSINKALEKEGVLSDGAVRRLSKRVEEQSRTALQAYGYYESNIDLHLQEGDEWTLGIDITPGPQTHLRDVRIEFVGDGANASELRTLIETSGLKQGAVLSHQRYSAYKSAVTKTAFNLGYLDGQFEKNELRVYPELQAADVILEFNTGKPYFFGALNIEQDILNDDFVRRFVKPEEGDAFESSKLVQLQLALSETNYFSHVDVDVKREEAIDQRIPVTIKAGARKASKYVFSLGFGTDTGPRAGIGADFRRVNRNGHRLKTRLQLSAEHSTLAGQYLVPIGDVSSEFLDFTANVERETVNDVDATEYRIGSSLNQNRWGGRRRLGLDLLHENWSFGDGPSNNATILLPSLNFTFKNADDPFFARRGYSYTALVQGAAENVASDVSFAQLQLFASTVFALNERSRLLLRGEFGAMATDNFDDLPPSLRFFAGGSQSVRGYGYKDLSPRDENGNIIGGKYVTALSAEVDYLIYQNYGIAAFVDAGDATRDPVSQFKVGAGVGFRYRSPVGMLRFDVAHPFDDPDESFRIHLSFGIDL
ncbi:MAG: autotransporter assembly complex family protein [Pseudomonadales bacterium]